jgi:PAS domain S-box-containing protein
LFVFWGNDSPAYFVKNRISSLSFKAEGVLLEKKAQSFLQILSLQQVLETIPSGLFLVDRDQRIVYWNAEAERITGFKASEVLGRHCSFLAGIPCGKSCGLFDQEVEKPIIGVSCTVKCRKGRRLTLLKNVDYLRDGEGNILGGIESFIDITRRKELEKKLRLQTRELAERVKNRTAELEEERTRLKTALDAMTDLAYIIDRDRRVVFMNRAMLETFGGRAEETCYREFQERNDPCPGCPLPQVLAGRTVREERFVEKTNRTYEAIHTPLRAADGTVQKLAVYRDITERKESEEKLRQANRELDSFVYTVSHDLRTPLTPIIGYAEFLQEEYRDRLDEKALDVLEEIQKQGSRMLALLEDLLALARVGQPAFSGQATDVAVVVQEVIEDLAEAIQETGAKVTVVSSLPPIALPSSLLSEVFANLIGNALRYAGSSGRPIEVGGRRVEEGARYFIRDHGPGIPPQERDRIFDLFCRGRRTESIPGTGLGLAIVRKICRLYGGRTWVEETPGGGSTFWVELKAGANFSPQSGSGVG